MRKGRSLKHLTLATVKTLIVVFVICFILTFVDSYGGDFDHWLITLSISVVTTIVAAIAMLVWGIPTHIYMHRKNLKSWTYYLLSGFVPGIVFVYVFKPFGDEAPYDLFLQAVQCGAIGSFIAVVFWLSYYKLRITSR